MSKVHDSARLPGGWRHAKFKEKTAAGLQQKVEGNESEKGDYITHAKTKKNPHATVRSSVCIPPVAQKKKKTHAKQTAPFSAYIIEKKLNKATREKKKQVADSIPPRKKQKGLRQPILKYSQKLFLPTKPWDFISQCFLMFFFSIYKTATTKIPFFKIFFTAKKYQYLFSSSKKWCVAVKFPWLIDWLVRCFDESRLVFINVPSKRLFIIVQRDNVFLLPLERVKCALRVWGSEGLRVTRGVYDEEQSVILRKRDCWSCWGWGGAERVLRAVDHVEEPVLVALLVVDVGDAGAAADQGLCVHHEEKSLIGVQREAATARRKKKKTTHGKNSQWKLFFKSFFWENYSNPWFSVKWILEHKYKYIFLCHKKRKTPEIQMEKESDEWRDLK